MCFQGYNRPRLHFLASRRASYRNSLLSVIVRGALFRKLARPRCCSDSDGAHLTPQLWTWTTIGARRPRFLVFAVRFVGLPAVPQNFQNYEPTAEYFLLP